FIMTLCDGQLIRSQQLNPDMFLSPDWIKLLPPELVETTLYHFDKAWCGEAVSYALEWPGDRVYFVMLQPILRSGQVVEVVGSVMDVTEKQRMERALEESERHY